MGAAERREKIMRILCRRRHETISNIAHELGVSQRTVQRDVEILSMTEPVYTQCGRYNGGVYVIHEYNDTRMHMTDAELSVIHKLLSLAKKQAVCALEDGEIKILRQMILQYTKPKTRKERKNEKKGKRVI